jgi:collagen type VII alpha
MKKIYLITLLFLYLVTPAIAGPSASGQGGSGSGVQLDSNCNQSQYYAIGKLCADTGTGNIYRGTGLGVALITGGVAGTNAYVYIAYASDSSGTGFTTTYSSLLNYIAILSSTTVKTPVVGDFAGLWFNYKGATGPQGIQGATGPQGSAGATGSNGSNGVSILWQGSLASAPSTPTLNMAYRNTISGIAYIYNGSSWVEMVQDGAGGVTGNTVPTSGNGAEWDTNLNLSANQFIAGYASTVTAATTTTLTVASVYNQNFTGTTTQTVVLPVATTLVSGWATMIFNNSTGVVTVQTSGGSTVLAIPASSSLFVLCINPAGGTGLGSWWTASPPTLASLGGAPLVSPGLTTPSITTSIAPASAGGATDGTAALPWSSVYIGGAHSYQITAAAPVANETVTLSDIGAAGYIPLLSATSTTAGQVPLSTTTAGKETYTSWILSGSASQTYYFPSTTATLARTDAGQTFTGVDNFTSPGLTTPSITTSIAPASAGGATDGTAALPWSSVYIGGAHSYQITAAAPVANETVTLSDIGAAGYIPLLSATSTTAGQVPLSTTTAGKETYTSWILSGSASQTYTFPSTTATLARTDAGQTFTGVDNFTSPGLTTPSITTSIAPASAGGATDGTAALPWSSVYIGGAHSYQITAAAPVANETVTLSDIGVAGYIPLLSATSTTAGQVPLSTTTAGKETYTSWILSGSASQTYTFPSTTATLARTDAGQTFTGVDNFTSPGLTTPSITTSIAPASAGGATDGTAALPWSSVYIGGAHSYQITAAAPVANETVTLSDIGVAGYIPLLSATSTTAGQVPLSTTTAGKETYTSWILSGSASQTYTFPSTTATLARTDAGQTFTGVDNFTSPGLTTPSITTSIAPASAGGATDGTAALPWSSVYIGGAHSYQITAAAPVANETVTLSDIGVAGYIPLLSATSTTAGQVPLSTTTAGKETYTSWILSGSASQTYTFPSTTATLAATIASGSLALATSTITSLGCQTITQGSVNSAAASNVVSTDTIQFTPNTSIKAIAGYQVSSSYNLPLIINAYPTAGYVNFDVCNGSSMSITPGALTINWRVVR